MKHVSFALCLVSLATACQSTGAGGAQDPKLRQTLLDSVKSLEGTWEGPGQGGQTMRLEFHVASNGSIVREVMFPGTPHEMLNVYSLDGNSLLVTHYCAMGNQPHMRATGREGRFLDFRCDSVSDLDKPDEMYMGELTLELPDQDHLVEHWRTFSKGKHLAEQNVDFALTRVK